MTTTATDRRTFPGLSPTAFEHPIDRGALDALRRTPGLDILLKKLSSLGFERVVRLQLTADSLRLSPKQLGRIHGLMMEGCEVLDMKPPELYLYQSPIVDAQALGMDRFTIGLSSGLIDLLNEDQLRWAIARELGHIKSGHMLYRTMAKYLAVVGLISMRNLPIVNLLSQALLYAFYDWLRKSELTADRAASLVAQDSTVGVSALLKLAGGTVKEADPLNVEEFLKQADDYEDMDESLLNVLYKFEMTKFRTHPFPAMRAREVMRWHDSGAYRQILQGNYARMNDHTGVRNCSECGASVENASFRYCPECGRPVGE